jgi:hypothetical protein
MMIIIIVCDLKGDHEQHYLKGQSINARLSVPT